VTTPADTTPQDDDVFLPAIPPGAPVIVVLVEMDGCPACEEFHPVFVKTAAPYAQRGLPIIRVDANSPDPVAQRWMNALRVEATPTLIAVTMRRGPVGRLEGTANPLAISGVLNAAWVHNR
jgi:thiol-disulfide isomerase/thioredoxin